MRAKSHLTTSVKRRIRYKTSPTKNVLTCHFVSTSWALEDILPFLPVQIIICETNDTEKSEKQKQGNMWKQQTSVDK